MGLFYLLFFCIWPFGALILSFIKYSKKWTKNLIWAFVVFYGYTFVISNDTMDANRLLARFETAIQFKGDIHTYFLRLFVLTEGNINFIEPFIHYLVALFTDNFQILMAVFGLIFGYFYSRNICYLIDYIKPSRITLYSQILLFTFIFIIGYWEINGFRFWTAIHIFFYALIPYFTKGKKGRLWWLLVAFLLHYSLLLPISFFLIYLVLGNRTKMFFYMFLVTFLISSINITKVGDIMQSFLPSIFESKINEKMSDKALAKDELHEFGMAGRIKSLVFIAINISYVLLYYFNRFEIKKRETLYNYFSFTLLMLILGNLGGLIPQGGGRFSIVAALFCISFLIILLKNFELKYPLKQFMPITASFFLLGILGFIRMSFNTTNIIAIIGNPILTIFYDPHKALIYYLPFL